MHRSEERKLAVLKAADVKAIRKAEAATKKEYASEVTKKKALSQVASRKRTRSTTAVGRPRPSKPAPMTPYRRGNGHAHHAPAQPH